MFYKNTKLQEKYSHSQAGKQFTMTSLHDLRNRKEHAGSRKGTACLRHTPIADHIFYHKLGSLPVPLLTQKFITNYLKTITLNVFYKNPYSCKLSRKYTLNFNQSPGYASLRHLKHAHRGAEIQQYKPAAHRGGEITAFQTRPVGNTVVGGTNPKNDRAPVTLPLLAARLRRPKSQKRRPLGKKKNLPYKLVQPYITCTTSQNYELLGV